MRSWNLDQKLLTLFAPFCWKLHFTGCSAAPLCGKKLHYSKNRSSVNSLKEPSTTLRSALNRWENVWQKQKKASKFWKCGQSSADSYFERIFLQKVKAAAVEVNLLMFQDYWTKIRLLFWKRRPPQHESADLYQLYYCHLFSVFWQKCFFFFRFSVDFC